jgi:hypothetical protein
MKKLNLVVGGVIAIIVLLLAQRYFLKKEGFNITWNNAPCTKSEQVVNLVAIKLNNEDGESMRHNACLVAGNYPQTIQLKEFDTCMFGTKEGTKMTGFFGNNFTDPIFTLNSGEKKQIDCNQINSFKIYQ